MKAGSPLGGPSFLCGPAGIETRRIPPFPERNHVIEINWGKPLSFVVSPAGDIQEFSTAEQARHWLRKKWPVADPARDRALHLVEAAMDCMASVGTARRAFISAARTAGFVPDGLMTQPERLAA